MIKRLMTVLLLLLLIGCNSLPDGEPPADGAIVKIPVKTTYSPLGAANLLSASLIAGSIGELTPASRVMLKASTDIALYHYAHHVMRTAQRTLGFSVSETAADYLLQSTFKPLGNELFEWEMFLTKSDQTLWRQTVIMDSKATN